MGQILLPLNSVAQLPKLVLGGSSGPGDDEASDYTAHYVKEKLNQMQLLLYNSKTELSVFLNYFWFHFPSPLSAHWFLAYKEKLQRTQANPTLLFKFRFLPPFFLLKKKKYSTWRCCKEILLFSSFCDAFAVLGTQKRLNGGHGDVWTSALEKHHCPFQSNEAHIKSRPFRKTCFQTRIYMLTGYWSLIWLKGRSETHTGLDKRYIKWAKNSHVVT